MMRTLTRTQLVADLVGAIVLALIGRLAGNQFTGGFDIVVLLLFAAALALRRLTPGIALAVAWLAAIVQMGAQLTAPAFADVAVLIVLYSAAAYGGRITRWLALASVGAGALCAALYLVVLPFLVGDQHQASRVPTQTTGEISRTFILVLIGFLALLGLSWTLGQLMRIYRRARASRRAQLEAEREVAAEQERNRIARDVHDVVAHSLAVVIAQADGARYLGSRDPEAVETALATIASTARSALGEVRVLLSELRHSPGESAQPDLDDLDRLLEQFGRAGLTTERTMCGQSRPLPAVQQLAVYRIVQEALTNALRHGDSQLPVELDFTWTESHLSVRVRNALVSEASDAEESRYPAPSGGHGLAGMRERAGLAHATLTAGPESGYWVVVARLEVP